jgi:hypothetical protein
MKVLTKVSPDDLKSWATSNWELLKEKLNMAIEKLPIECQKVSYNDNELIASLFDDQVTIQPEIKEIRSISGIKEQPGWSIISWKHEPETDYTPADFVPFEEKNTSNTIGAAVIAVKSTFDLLMEIWGESQYGCT